ncbi:MAG: GxxExxY protein [Candidatus Schekmanbacteria bacterium]|nr:GxxExxY protein [Candidatus Schekmanbacteria bacterium]
MPISLANACAARCASSSRASWSRRRLVVVEAKAVTRIEPVHEVQLLSYLKLSSAKIGLIIPSSAGPKPRPSGRNRRGTPA